MTATRTKTAIVNVAGNPNTGKTSIFNRLTGRNLKVGNYPGVTVERIEGRVKSAGHEFIVCDVPGTYSLSARTSEEAVAVAAVAGIPPNTMPDVNVVVVDATQLSRNLYLALQTLETGVPMVVALSMADMAARRQMRVDIAALQEILGVPVVAVNGVNGKGIDDLKVAIVTVLENPQRGRGRWRWTSDNAPLKADIEAVAAAIPAAWTHGEPQRREALARWALLSAAGSEEMEIVPTELRAAVNERHQLAQRDGRDLDLELIETRYRWIDDHIPHVLELAAPKKRRTEKLDAIMLHPVGGFALFLLIMGVVFQSLFSWADPAIAVVEHGMAWLAMGIEAVVPASLFQDFLVDGIVAGVGSVLVFLPQILLLFFFIGLMEDSGYMARVAFLMDRIMRSMGLHGRAFVPMLSGFACAVPAILATRTLERKRDRYLTMMVVPLMTCSARLPVYTLIIAALFPPTRLWGVAPVQGLLMVGMYLFSVIVALAVAAVLSRTVFKGIDMPLILEMPPYRRPHMHSVVRMMWMRSSMFLREAGGVILVCTIVLWGLLSFPRNPSLETDYDALQRLATRELQGEAHDTRLAELKEQREGEVFRRSYGARMGMAIEPILAPLGFDWKIGIGIIGAFAAREVFVSTLGVVYGVGSEVDESSATLRQKIQRETRADGSPLYTPMVGLSLMIFFALACQCMSTLAAVYRETQTWRWPVFLMVYMTVLAWVASFAVYQGGRALGFA